MSKHEHLTGRIAALTRLQNSYCGNPRWAVQLAMPGGTSVLHNTAANASVNYEIGNTGLRVGDLVTLLVNGRGTIDYITSP
jgi:hypothetical protein